MAKTKKSLDTILRHRKTQEELAQKEFAEAQFIATTKESEIQQVDGSVKEAMNRRGDFTQDNQFVSTVMAVYIDEFIVGQGLRRVKKVAELEELEKNVESKREILREKAIERKIIGKLIDRKNAQKTLEEKKKEAKIQDELAQLKANVRDDDEFI